MRAQEKQQKINSVHIINKWELKTQRFDPPRKWLWIIQCVSLTLCNHEYEVKENRSTAFDTYDEPLINHNMC